MLSFSLSFWLPSATGAVGLMKYLVWFFTLETKWEPESGVFGLRVRFCGIGTEILTFLPFLIKNEPQMSVSATAVGVDGTKREVPLTPEAAEWVKGVAKYGIKMLIERRDMHVDADNLFIFPASLNEVEVSIGDRILFGDKEDHILVKVTGSREQEDRSRIFYTTRVPMQ